MPLYEYECKKCHHRFERIQRFSDPHVKKCPKCGGPIEQVISAAAVQFKGSGWYVTDYAKKSSSGSSDSGSSDSGSSDSDSSAKLVDKDSGSKTRRTALPRATPPPTPSRKRSRKRSHSRNLTRSRTPSPTP